MRKRDILLDPCPRHLLLWASEPVNLACQLPGNKCIIRVCLGTPTERKEKTKWGHAYTPILCNIMHLEKIMEFWSNKLTSHERCETRRYVQLQKLGKI